MSVCKEQTDQATHQVEEGTSSCPNRTVDEKKKALQGLSILLVEDHEVLQKIGVAMLKSLGARVTLVQDGQSAVEAVTLMINAAPQNQIFHHQEPRHYDLILMDCQMDNMNGCDATRKIRKLEEEAEQDFRIPIIAFTALVAQDHQQECLDAGMDNFLKKPTKQHLLVATIVETLAKKKQSQAFV